MPFESELPKSYQSQLITLFTQEEYPHGFPPPAKVIKTLASFVTPTGSSVAEIKTILVRWGHYRTMYPLGLHFYQTKIG
jgi:hypothetical protein